MERIKLYLGPMSKNVVDAIIDYANEYEQPLGLIASRRQIDHASGYVNGWITETFAQYVRERTNRIVLCRDHGGPGQGDFSDDGVFSILEDIKYMDIIHIDPWKALDFEKSIDYTVSTIKMCSDINDKCVFEIGTEESIFPMNLYVFETFLIQIKEALSKELFSKIAYAVIQSGTALEAGKNTGTYNKYILSEMIQMCKHRKILCKEHNGDYLKSEVIKDKFGLGLSAINIAPELAHIETSYILENIDQKKFKEWYALCIKDGHWKKWFPLEFDPAENKHAVVILCGHYVFSHPEFKKIFDLNSIYEKVKIDIHNFIKERINE